MTGLFEMRPGTLGPGASWTEATEKGLHAICEFSGELKPLGELNRCGTPDVEEPDHCYTCGQGPMEFNSSQAAKGSHARCPECVNLRRTGRFQAFRQRATQGDQDVHFELMKAVEEINDANVLRALEAGANPDCARPLVVRDPQTGLHRAMYLADGTAVPQVAPEQPTSPLKMAVFRISDCMLDETSRLRLVTIARRLIEHGAPVEAARGLFELRYGSPDADPEPDDNAFNQMYDLLR